MNVDAELGQAALRTPAELVVAERGEELAPPGELRELARHHRAAAGRLLPAGGRRARSLPPRACRGDARELDPLDMTDDGASHNFGTLPRFQDDGSRDEQIPPFERFYLAHRDEVLGYLRRLLGQRAEDAWQETFLRALRAYDRLEHGRHLRAWVFTIATNVAIDELRGRPEPAGERRARASSCSAMPSASSSI